MNFETLIRDAIKQGKSLEDIASEVGATLNKVQAETKTKADGKEMLLNEWRDIFDEHYKANHLDLTDAAALATLVCEKNYPNWTKEDLNQFRESIKTSISTLADMQTKDLSEIISGLFNDLFETKEKKACGDCAKAQPESDRLRIRKFLNTL